jgi:hypothetical protein
MCAALLDTIHEIIFILHNRSSTDQNKRELAGNQLNSRANINVENFEI